MMLPESLQNAVRTLTGALDLLEAAVERRVQAETTRGDREQEVALMQEDRARLGEELELSEQSRDRLRDAGLDVAERLVRMDALCVALRRRVAK